MKASMKVEKPGEIEMTATLTMTMAQWDDVRKQLEHKWPSTWLSSVIHEMLMDAQRVYYPSDDAESTRPDDG